MAINVNAAHNQAAQLESFANNDLIQARNNLNTYKSTLNSNWQSTEMAHINTAIDQVIAQINVAINSLISIGADIRSNATSIKREEDAAAAAALAKQQAAKRQVAINKATQDLNNAKAEMDRLKKGYDDLAKTITSKSSVAAKKAVEDALKVFQNAQNNVSNLQKVLNSLPR